MLLCRSRMVRSDQPGLPRPLPYSLSPSLVSRSTGDVKLRRTKSGPSSRQLETLEASSETVAIRAVPGSIGEVQLATLKLFQRF